MKGPSKAEIRSKEQSEKTERFRENLWHKIQLKGPEIQLKAEGPYKQKQLQEQNKKKGVGKLGWFMSLT